MEERILIKSHQYNVKKLFVILLIVGAVLSILVLLACTSEHMERYNAYYDTYLRHQDSGSCGWYYYTTCYECETIEIYSSPIKYAFDRIMDDLLFILIPVASLALIGGFLYLWLRSYELTVTDKRIFGKVAWGKRVDLPVDSVSATATIRLLKGVSVSTSSGRISFRILKNANEIYQVISNLLIERQHEKSKNVVVAAPVSDEADQLKKYKELLDGGVISQEEFDKKKKQLLGL